MKGLRSLQTTEHDEQASLFIWAESVQGMYPELKYLFAIPNAGKRSIRAGKWMKAEGLKSGVPDVMLPAARRGYHGLFIEMKIGNNKPTDNQRKWLKALREAGYYTTVCHGWLTARDLIKDYLEGER